MHNLPLFRAIGWSLVALFAIETTGCHSWQASTQPLPQVFASPGAKRFRIHLQDGRVVEVDSARVVADSVVGFQSGAKVAGQLGDEPGKRQLRVTVPTSEVRTVETYREDVGMRRMVAIGVIVVGVIVGVLVYQAFQDFSL